MAGGERGRASLMDRKLLRLPFIDAIDEVLEDGLQIEKRGTKWLSIMIT